MNHFKTGSNFVERTIEDLKSYLGQDWLAVQDGIRAYLGSDISLLNATNENLLSHSGKQLRPMIALLVARACGGAANADSIKLAVASELLHNATLLHDDVADEADQRRGEPTLRKLMGPSVSVLVGDFWLVRAVKAILEVSRNQVRTIGLFARTLSDLAEGEMLQLQKADSGDTDFEDYLEIIYRKTASLFTVTTIVSAMSVGASPEMEQASADYGRYLGLAFQMRDDIFDYMPQAHVGKPVGVDILEQKITLPLLCALEKVRPEEQRAIRAGIRNVTQQTRDGIISFVLEHDGVPAAQKVLEEYVAKAVEALSPLPDTPDKELLAEIAGYIAIRNN